jgi:ATP-binding cassette subfamily B protein
LNVFRFLKPEWKAALLILLLLIAQAASELALPAYTSSLVDIGVQQGGIASAAAQKLSQPSFDRLLLLLDGKDQSIVKDAYILNNGVYELRPDMEQEQRDAVAQALTLPMSVLFTMQNSAPGGLTLLDQGIASGMVTPEMIISQARERMGDQGAMGDQFTKQVAVQFVKSEYQALGIDLDALRNQYLWAQGIRMLGLTLLMGLAAILVSLVSSRTAATVGKRLRRRVYAKVLSFSAAEIEQFTTASLITRSTNDVNQVQQTSVMLLRMVLYAPILAAGGIWRVIQVRTGMGWIIGLAVALMIALVGTIALTVVPKFKIMQKLIDRMNMVARENLTGVAVIRAFSRQAHENKRYDKANEDLTAVNRFINRAFVFAMPALMLVMNGMTMLIIWFGAKGIDMGRMQVGDMIAFISYTMMIVMAFIMMTMASVIMLPRAEVAAQRIRAVLDTEPAIKSPDHPEQLPLPVRGEIEFRHVSFSYPDSDEQVLHDLNFTVKPGETTAVIGATGSGKSTMLQLIPRFYDVTEGQILLDGIDIRHLTLSALREHLGYVPQKSSLFSGTIGSNIGYAGEDITQADMEEAARIAQGDKFIREKEEGYGSVLSQGATNLSGGQKQRVSIARALASKPQILLFDDSFSALDYRTDLQVRQALKEKLKSATVLIVAQRIATVMQADKILVMDNGELKGQGTHEQLMHSSDVYRQIAQSQLTDEELGVKEGGRHE